MCRTCWHQQRHDYVYKNNFDLLWKSNTAAYYTWGGLHASVSSTLDLAQRLQQIDTIVWDSNRLRFQLYYTTET